MAIENTVETINNLMESLDRKRYVLPNFQRGFVWEAQKQQALIASFLVKLPIGSLLALKGKKEDFASRTIGSMKESVPEGDCEYLLDGQQRLTTLRGVFYDFFESDTESWENVWGGLPSNLRYRWFLKIKPSDDQTDVFGYQTLEMPNILQFDQEQILDLIIYRRIFKGKDSESHHPAFVVKDDTGALLTTRNQRDLELAKLFAAEGIVPLWTVYKGQPGKGLHEKVLDRIGEDKVDKLKAVLEDSDDYKEKLKEIFDDPSEMIKFFESGDTRGQNRIWDRRSVTWANRVTQHLHGLLETNLPLIKLPGSEINRAVSIFEAINRGGAPLSVFDLVVARAARDKSRENLSVRICEGLREKVKIERDFNKSFYDEKDGEWSSELFGTIDDTEPSSAVKDWYLNVISLLYYVIDEQASPKVEHMKKGAILNLSSWHINNRTEDAIRALNRAFCFVQLRCGVPSARSMPYKLMLIPIALALTEDEIWENPRAIERIEYWYWISLLSGRYLTAQNEVCKNDITKLRKFIDDGADYVSQDRQRILNNGNEITKEILLRVEQDVSEPANIRDGILQYLMSTEPADFLDNMPKLTAWSWHNDANYETHHVIPLKTAASVKASASDLRGKKAHPLNSALNLAVISKEANRFIGDTEPTTYFANLPRASIYLSGLPNNLEKEPEELLSDRYEFLRNKIEAELKELQPR